MEHIRVASGASNGSIYHHFGSKQAIALELYEEGRRRYETDMLAALHRETAPEAGVRALVAGHLRWGQAHRDWSLLLTRLGTADIAGEFPERIATLHAGFAKAVHAWFAPFIRRRLVADLPPEIFLLQALGPGMAFARLWLAGATALDVKAAARLLANAAWKSLRGSASP